MLWVTHLKHMGEAFLMNTHNLYFLLRNEKNIQELLPNTPPEKSSVIVKTCQFYYHIVGLQIALIKLLIKSSLFWVCMVCSDNKIIHDIILDEPVKIPGALRRPKGKW